MDLPLTRLKGVGEKRLEALEAAGIASVRALIERLPAEYRDLSDVRGAGTLQPGEEACVRARVTGGVKPVRVGKLVILSVKLEDETGSIRAVWYNQPWLKDTLAPGRELLLFGKVENRGSGRQLSAPAFVEGEGIQPVYKPVSGVPAKVYASLVNAALSLMEGQWPDELPETLRRRHGLCERNYAMLNAHHPISRDALEAARRRISFEELLVYQMALGLLRGVKARGVRVESAASRAEEYWAALGFAPTGAQRRVLDEVLSDMQGEGCMARMVQGDVGCGKTAIAFGALYACARAGYQGALMAPTEVLAAQHYAAARALFEPMGISVGLLTGSLTPAKKREAHGQIASGAWRVVVGTHALITDAAQYERLGLVVTDEQHRFGVRQRTRLSEKGDSPNVLVMSATPIPRTLSLILYGDLDLSVVDELPPGRTPVKTRVVPEEKREGMYGFVRAQIAAGRQAYVVCPLVEDSEAVDAASAVELYDTLREGALKGLRVGLAHGQQKPKEKEEALEAFRAGDLDVLVSTTVIEVGVNVPNASVMIVENADRFGLAQLHQLRGRVGRGAAESWCFLMAEPNERLRLMTRTNDGFEIARKDLEIRGPGELFGFRQSGAAALGLSDAAGDAELLKETHDEARSLLQNRESEESRAVEALAREALSHRLDAFSMN